jgi:hypothetical protein
MTKTKYDEPRLYYFYKLVCNDPSITEFYIGSTANWNDRKTKHKSSITNKNHTGYTTKKAQTIRKNGGWNNWSMIELERGTYIKRMAEAHEYELMVQLKSTMNKQKCFNSNSKCEHGIMKQDCKQCNGSSICEHDKQKRICKICKGSSTCDHGYADKRMCPYCNPYLCECGSWTTIGHLKRHYKSTNCKAFHMKEYNKTYV